jgi:hypothetical protein
MNLSIDVEFGACQFGGVCLICCGVQAIFNHKFFIPEHPLHQSGICLVLEKYIIVTKMKTAEWLVFYEDLSHFPMEITTSGLKCTMCA